MKIDDKKIPKILKRNSIYPAYHMNKKYWISVILDDNLNDDYVTELLDKVINTL